MPKTHVGGCSGFPSALRYMLTHMQVDCLYEVINKLGKEAAAAENSSLAAGSISRVSGVTDTTEVPEVPPPQPVALAPAQATDNQPSLVYAAQEVA